MKKKSVGNHLAIYLLLTIGAIEGGVLFNAYGIRPLPSVQGKPCSLR